MTNKLEQIEASIEFVNRINKGLSNTHETLLAEALTLLKDVEEGKVHIAQWSDADNHAFISGDLMFGLDDEDEPIAALRLSDKWTETPTRVLLFNGFHVIPIPKEGA